MKKSNATSKEDRLSAKRVAQDLREFNLWRRGVGVYAFNEDPKKNIQLPFGPSHLTKVIDRAVELIEEM